MLTTSIVFGIILGIQTLYFKSKVSNAKLELKDTKELFRITYDILWMEVRDKNDLTYDNMAMHIVSMQKAELGNVRETIAMRITGKSSKKIGF